MVAKRIRSEYMKKFKDPKWGTYTKCYEEMFTYRLSRRLLEHTHNPWFWSGSDSDSDSGGRSPSHPSQVEAETGREKAEPEVEEGEKTRTGTQPEQTVPRLLVQNEEENSSALQSAAHGLELDVTKEFKEPQSEEEGLKVSSRDRKPLTHPHNHQVKGNRGPRPQKTKPSKSTKQTWRSQQVRPAPSQQLREDIKESRHPFALYGSGEKDANIADRKTHNVGPAASTTEIHESALRAKTRREVERQIQSQRIERRRAKSADPNKTRTSVPVEFNPWLTEYMRCFSARAR